MFKTVKFGKKAGITAKMDRRLANDVEKCKIMHTGRYNHDDQTGI